MYIKCMIYIYIYVYMYYIYLCIYMHICTDYFKEADFIFTDYF